MTNLINNSNFSGSFSTWTGLSATDQVSGISPNENGVTTAFKITNTTTANVYQDVTTSATTYYVRFYIKYLGTDIGASDPVTIRLDRDPNGSIDNQFNLLYTASIGSDWIRVTQTFTGTAGGTYRFKISQAITGTTDYYHLTDIYIGTSSSYCFNKGTEILCLKNNTEQYIPIETINKETDLIKTYRHGYKKVEGVYHSLFKNNPNSYKNSMYIMKKQENMTKDLIVTGGHSILVDNYKNDEIRRKHKKTFGSKLDPIDDKQLLLAGFSDSFTQIKGDDIYDIYHIVLEGEDGVSKRYGIWANGVLTESAYKNIL